MNKNCLSYWFPIIEAAGVRVPKTEILRIDNDIAQALFGPFDGKPFGDAAAPFFKSLREAAERMGFPCFLRTGQTSNKHNWRKSCFLTDPDEIGNHMLSLIEFSELACIFGLPWDVWVVREMLPTIPQMVADRYGNMPVCREFRFFVRNGEVECVHPYWPKEALEQGISEEPEDFDWRHTCLSYMPANDERELYGMASRAGAAVGGYWSVDILETKQGWYVTDMADGDHSYHMEGCDKAKVTP